MTGYGEGLYRRRRDGATVACRSDAPSRSPRAGWEPIDPATGEPLVADGRPPRTRSCSRTNVYASSKRYQEELALGLGAFYGIPTTCLRLFNVFGPRQSLSNPYTGVLAIFLSRLLGARRRSSTKTAARRATSSRCTTWSARSRWRRAAAAADGIAVNVGTGVPRGRSPTSRARARALLGRTIAPQITGQFRKGDIRHCFADTTRARTVLGFEPQADWDAALLETAALVGPRATRRATFAQAAAELAAFGIVGPPRRLTARRSAPHVT